MSVSVVTVRICRGFGCCRLLSRSEALLAHCRDARYVWNLAVEQQQHWQPGRKAPGYVRAVRAVDRGSRRVRVACGLEVRRCSSRRCGISRRPCGTSSAGTHRRPRWRKAGVHEGFRQVGVKPHHVERLNRRFGRVWVPKVGWVRFRLSRPVPEGVKSYRVTRDRAGRWHVAFAHVPGPIAGPGDGSVVGIDRGVAVSAALSTGELLHAPGLTPGEAKRLKVLQQRLARARRGSNRREKTKRAIAKLKARERDRRKDWVEKTSTDLARRFDVIRVEALDVRGDDPLCARHRRATGCACRPETRAQPRNQPKRLGPAGRTFAAQGFRPGRAGSGRLHVATMLRVRARRTRKPQEPSGLRVRSLHCWTVQRRRQRCTQHRRRTGGDSTGRPRQLGGLRTVNLNSLLLPHKSMGWGLESLDFNPGRT